MGKDNKAGTRAGSSGRKEASSATEHAPQTPGELQAHAMKMIDKHLTGADSILAIHMLRDQVRAKFGDHAASPAVFDKAIMGLKREGKLSLHHPSDNRDLTVSQHESGIFDSFDHSTYNPDGPRWASNYGYITKPE